MQQVAIILKMDLRAIAEDIDNPHKTATGSGKLKVLFKLSRVTHQLRNTALSTNNTILEILTVKISPITTLSGSEMSWIISTGICTFNVQYSRMNNAPDESRHE